MSNARGYGFFDGLVYDFLMVLINPRAQRFFKSDIGAYEPPPLADDTYNVDELARVVGGHIEHTKRGMDNVWVELQIAIIKNMLLRHNGNIAEAARCLSLGRTTLMGRMVKFGFYDK